MNDILNKEFLIIVLSLIMLLAITLFFVLHYIRRKTEREIRERYDFKNHLVELEYMRKNMEMQLYDVSRKLEENESRWKDINHLVINSQNKLEIVNSENSKVVPNEFLKSLGISNSKEFEVDDKQVFVLTPFNDNYRETFFTIRKVCEKLNLRCFRGDEEFIPNDILPSILRQIVKSRLIIVNISGRNPNVMYELGLAHALGKPTIIISHNFTEIPFDLGNKRIIIFNNEEDLKLKLENSITDMLINRAL